jgi:hypothetical protein
MAPRPVLCSLCGGKFFKASLAHHQKVCCQKVGKQCHECPYCHALWPMLELDAHILTCGAAQAAGGRPTGASAALEKRLRNYRDKAAAGIPDLIEEQPVGGGGMGDISECGDCDDTRIACQFCGRKFAMDRIGKHQAICQKLSSKPCKKPKIFHDPSKPAPAPMRSKWRAQSENFRDACRAGRGVSVQPPASTPAPPSVASASNHHLHPAAALAKEQFNRLDVNGDGVLSPEEMEQFSQTIDSSDCRSDSITAFKSADTNCDGKVDFDEFVNYVFRGSGFKPAVGSALAAVRQKGSPCAVRQSGTLQIPHVPRSGAFRRRSAPEFTQNAKNSPRTGSQRSTRRSSDGALRPTSSRSPLPEWGSAASSRSGIRECMTSCPVRTTPHNTSWGGCTSVAVTDKDGLESTRCSLGNPLDRSWLYENRLRDAGQPNLKNCIQNSAALGTPAAPVLLGRSFKTKANNLVSPCAPAAQALLDHSNKAKDNRHVHFE